MFMTRQVAIFVAFARHFLADTYNNSALIITFSLFTQVCIWLASPQDPLHLKWPFS